MFHLKMIEYRKKNMMTQEELADRLGVSRQTITKWEKGTILPSLEYLIDLSRLFGVTIDHLVKDDDCICESSDVYKRQPIRLRRMRSVTASPISYALPRLFFSLCR